MSNRERPEDGQEGDLAASETNASDHSLLRRLRTGDEDAATAMYVKYAERLRLLANRQFSRDLSARVEAEDIVQSVFRTFFRRVAKGEYVVPEGEELWKLFLVIALNKIRKVGAYHRAARRDVRQTLGGEALDDRGATVADETPLAVLGMVIEELLAKLPEASRVIVRMRIEGYEVSDIATQTGRAKRSVERLLQGFRQELASMIEEAEA